MNIILFLNRDLESNFAYHLLKPALKSHEVRIYLSESVGGKKVKAADLEQLEYFERAYFFQWAHYLRIRNISIGFEFFDEYFTSAPLEICTDVNDASFVEKIKLFAPDLFISIRFGKIFHADMIGIPSLGVINLHSGILPDYRGILGTLHALREGRKKVGCTLHFIDNNTIDTGRIIEKAYLPVEPGRSLFWHVLNLYPLGCQMIEQALIKMDRGISLDIQGQDMYEGKYFSLPSDQHFMELKEMGFAVINREEYQDFLRHFIYSAINLSDLS